MSLGSVGTSEDQKLILTYPRHMHEQGTWSGSISIELILTYPMHMHEQGTCEFVLTYPMHMHEPGNLS